MTCSVPVRFDVVIPARNAADTILEQLAGVRRNDCAELLEVVVVDSHSTDRTVEVVQEYAESTWGKVRVVATDGPGANAARNAGIAAGQAEVVLLCDADDVVSAEWASALTDALKDAEAVRGRYDVTRLNDADTIAMRGPLGSTGAPVGDKAMGGLGGNCGFRRSVWEALGGLAADHTGSDDIEFFWRITAAGHRVGYVDDAVVHYRLRPGRRALYHQQRAWAENRALLYKQFARYGFIERRSLVMATRQWVWLLTRLHHLGSSDPQRRGQWIRALANAAGHVRGTFRHRTWYP